ncbi:hypothetical protein E3Q23_02790 [Wallemia mellicola]|uniref:Uncharacterized protein n=1 Tax=Wallemia mellicola TaxID=1708541 RepID=A0A4T0Q057_9BASI|nr:hypothetical protein E3Q24_04022 [Wallemia mellicola]TIB74085.1 hypothetical protein E3Q23_02790 [Wallemia mellicola]TIB83326.1 hypothetical protein E3Q21_02965 [Wallemia mellicola]TIB86196.1 hypothetical protein E3Q20_02957 [Wallemia mellicola]TIB98634.1 hypothetical protein E3Q17_02931 [Wallemia mellicola]
MTMFKLPEWSSRRSDAVVALSTQSTNNFDNINKHTEERRMSAAESLLMLSPNVRPTTSSSKSMSQSIPQANTMHKARSNSIIGSLPPSPPWSPAPATPIAFPSPRVIPLRKSSRDNSSPGSSLNDDPLDLDADAPFELDQVDEEDVDEEKEQAESPVVFNMDSFKVPGHAQQMTKTSSKTSSRSSSRGRRSSKAPDDERGRSRHKNSSKSRS